MRVVGITALPSTCLVAEQISRVEVGRGVALEEIDWTLVPHDEPCAIDAETMLRAREEGRQAPTVIAWTVTASTPGAESPMRVGRAAEPVEATIPARATKVQLRAILRGERFVVAPLLTTSASRASSLRWTFSTSSLWGPRATPGVASWVEAATPLLVQSDPTRDDAPLDKTATLAEGPSAAVIVLDAGPAIAGESTLPTIDFTATLKERLALGGASALSTILTDLPLSIVDASPNPESGDAIAIQRLGLAADVALVAERARDPLLAIAGDRLTAALAHGLVDCARDPEARPRQWPSVHPLAPPTSDDPAIGCPAVAHHRPSDVTSDDSALDLVREGRIALVEAALREQARNGAPSIAIGALDPHVPKRASRPDSAVRLGLSKKLRKLVFGLLAAALVVMATLFIANWGDREALPRA